MDKALSKLRTKILTLNLFLIRFFTILRPTNPVAPVNYYMFIKIIIFYHIFQGALLLFHKDSNNSLSLKVSIGCQKSS